MFIIKRLFPIFIILIFSFSIILPQETTPDLLDLLNTIPDTPENRYSNISYVNYRAFEVTREGVEQYSSWADLMAVSSETEGRLWFASSRGIVSGPPILESLIVAGEDWQSTVGFDFFDIDQAISYGEVPSNAMVLSGDFDSDTISSAFTEQGFTSEQDGDFILLCGANGCDDGLSSNFDNQQNANPFGGNRGRQEPLLVSDTMLVNSPDMAVLDEVLQTLDETGTPSIAQNPTFLSALNILNDTDSILLQAQFLAPSFFLGDVASLLMNPDLQGQLDILDEAIIPDYEIVFIADTTTNGEQVVYIVMVYDSIGDAEIASEIVLSRLENLESIRHDEPFLDIFAQQNVSDIQAYTLTDDINDKSLAILELRAPLVSNEEDIFGFVASSMVFRTVTELIYQRDTLWMMPNEIER